MQATDAPSVEIPAGIRHNKVVMLVLESPPPTPACFRGRKEWQEWLLLAHASGERITVIRDTGKYKDRQRIERSVRLEFAEIDHCADCTRERQVQMKKAGRCQPSATVWSDWAGRAIAPIGRHPQKSPAVSV